MGHKRDKFRYSNTIHKIITTCLMYGNYYMLLPGTLLQIKKFCSPLTISSSDRNISCMDRSSYSLNVKVIRIQNGILFLNFLPEKTTVPWPSLLQYLKLLVEYTTEILSHQTNNGLLFVPN